MTISRFAILKMIRSLVETLPWVDSTRVVLDTWDTYHLYVYVRQSKRFFHISVREDKDE